MIKRKIYEIAKDLNKTSKEIIAFLNQYLPSETVRKHNSLIFERELNLILEYFSNQNKVDSVEKYLLDSSLNAGKDKHQDKINNKPEDKVNEKVLVDEEILKETELKKSEATVPNKNQTKTQNKKDFGSKTYDQDKETKIIRNEKTQKSEPEQKKQSDKKDFSPTNFGNEKVQKTNNKNKTEINKTGENKFSNVTKSFSDKKTYQDKTYQDKNRKTQLPNGQSKQYSPRYEKLNSNLRNSKDFGNKDNNNYKNYNKDFAQRDRNTSQFSSQGQVKNQQAVNRNVMKLEVDFSVAPGSSKKQAKMPNQSQNNASKKQQNELKTVDMRTSDVNLDKYNEKYEQIASQNSKGEFSKKQKITSKSAQRAKQQFSKRESEAEKLKRIEEQRKKTKPSKIIVPEEIVVGELASKLKLPAAQVIKKLMLLGVMASVSQTIDYETASLIAEEFDIKCEKEVVVTIEERLFDETEDKKEDLVPRSPVVVVMGHVDHGKTSLLDAIRDADVISTEAGGITQHIGAYRVFVNNSYITFLDTPGHEAFTSMRARGAQITDVAILVVAADDGIMPQTIEAINHAKAAGVSIVVAINKIDKPEANIDKVKQALMDHELVPEEWGGDVICVPISAKKRQNIDTLLEMVSLVAEVRDLKANPNRLAKGTVIEAKLDKGRGPVATVLVQNGTLKQGDVIISGASVGKVRVMRDEHGNKVLSAGPSVPVEITGLSDVPSAGDVFNAVENEKLAKELVDKRKHELKQAKFNAYQKVTLDNLFSQISAGQMQELPIIVKADVNGSVEAMKQSLEKLSDNEIRVKVIHAAVGAINKSDVSLASASNAIVVGFNVRPDPVAREIAEINNTDIRLYRVIYDAIEEIKSAMKGMLAPKTREVDLGRAEIRKVYKISNVGTVTGCYVLDGKISRNCKIRLVRDGIIVADDEIKSLKRVKDDVKEVATGFECGISLTKFMDIKEGDILEAYVIEEYRD